MEISPYSIILLSTPIKLTRIFIGQGKEELGYNMSKIRDGDRTILRSQRLDTNHSTKENLKTDTLYDFIQNHLSPRIYDYSY